MPEDTEDGHDDDAGNAVELQLAQALAAYDEALAAGQTGSAALPGALPSAERRRFVEAGEVLRLLAQVNPRSPAPEN